MDEFQRFGVNGFQRFNSFGNPDISTTDGLLHLAQSRGGAVAQVAEEMIDPERSMLSTIGDKFKSAFAGFIDAIQTSSNVVAGAISPDLTIEQAMEKNTSVSEVLLGKTDPNASGMQKLGDFFVRLPIDILTDPLTYVTFGASSGILGLRALSKIKVSGETAKKLGVKEGSFVNLSERGQKLLNTSIENQRKGLAQSITAKEVRDSIPEFAKRSDEDIGQILAAKDDFAEAILQKTVNRKLDRESTVDAFGKMLARNPALTETLVDKGGIKFFGQSIISGQAVSSGLTMIPGMSLLDNVTAPARNATLALFSNKFSLGGRIPQETVDKIQKWKDLADSQKNAALADIPHVWRALGITAQEDEMIRAAVEARKLPSDPRLAELWKAMHGLESSVDERLLEGTRFIQRRNKLNIKQAWQAGFKVTEIPNYIPHILVKEETKSLPFSTPPSQTLHSAKQAKIAAFVNLRVQSQLDNVRKQIDNARVAAPEKIPELEDLLSKLEKDETLVGSAETLKLNPVIRDVEMRRIKENLQKNMEKHDMNIADLSRQATQLATRVQEFFRGKVAGEFRQVLDKVPLKDRMSVKVIMETINEQTPLLDIETLKKGRAATAFKDGLKIKKVTDDMSEEAAELMLARLAKGEAELPEKLRLLNEFLKTTEPKFPKQKSTHKGGAEGELADIMEALKDLSFQKRKELVDAELDKDQVTRIVQTLSEQFVENPNGVRRVLDAVIGNQQRLGDILNEIELDKLAAKQDLEDLPDNFRFFRGQDGDLFERVRATVEEAEAEGIIFEKSGLSTLLQGSLQTIRATVMRQFIDDVAGNSGIVASKAPPGWREVSVTGLGEENIDLAKFVTGKEGEPLRFHPETAKRIEEFMGSVINDEATREVLKKFDKLQNLWKASVTSIFPAFHGRNAISNVFLNFLDIGTHALNPANHIMSAQLIANEGQFSKLTQQSYKAGKAGEKARAELEKLTNREVFRDRTGGVWTFGELRGVIQQNVVGFNPNIVGAIDITRTQAEQMRDIQEELFPELRDTGLKKAKRFARQSLPVGQQFAPFRVGRKVGNMVEEQARITNFIVNLRNTGDVQLAAQRTKQFLFDYQNLTPFEKAYMRRLMPFYTFTRKNLELQIDSLLTAPGRVAAEITAVTTLGDVISGGTLSEEEKKALPDWVQDGIGILRRRQGASVEIYSSLGTPIEQPFQQFQPNSLLGSISPILRIPLEQASGYSFFHGKALSDVTDAAAFKTAPQAMKDFIGYTEIEATRRDGTSFTLIKSLRPERMHLVQNLPPTSRVLSSLRQMQAQGVEDQSKTLQFLFGLRPFAFDIEREQLKRERELQQRMEDLLTEAGVTAQFQKTFIPKQ